MGKKDKKKSPRKIPEDIVVNAIYRTATDPVRDVEIVNPAEFTRRVLDRIHAQMDDEGQIADVYRENRDYSSIEDWTCFGPWRYLDRDFVRLFEGYARFIDLDPDLRIR